MEVQDTIVALATPPGRSGIGIVRLSGARSLAIAKELVRVREPLSSWCPARGSLLDEDRQKIDDVLITYFAGPRSYTSEDVVEIACHGSPVVLRACVKRALGCGARLAEPGEFTLRAFLLGKIDLPQAEAVRDLIDSTTLHQARVAAQQQGGSLSRALQPVKSQFVDLIALLEAGIDFAEDDVSVSPDAELLRRLYLVQKEIQKLAASYRYGQILRDGVTLAIVGRPNVGKSSLFNRLLEQERAIVTDVPGTTRDVISEVTAIHGIPVRLMDTAGIREAVGLVETLGIERSYGAMADADVCLVVLDATVRLEPRDRELLERAKSLERYLVVANKVDSGSYIPGEAIPVSALTGQGIDELRDAIIGTVAPGDVPRYDHAVITNLRQAEALEKTAEALVRAEHAIGERLPHEMLLIDLYEALATLDSLTGKTTADDILHRIFATFCIGK